MEDLPKPKNKQVKAMLNQAKFIKDTMQDLITKLETFGYFKEAEAYEKLIEKIEDNRSEVYKALAPLLEKVSE